MDIRVDGYRSSNEDWIKAHQVPADALPPITEEESLVAGKLGISAEGYQRSKYAGDLSRPALEQRADVVGEIVAEWLRERRVSGEVVGVWLRTFEGKYRVEVKLHDGSKLIFIREELVDDLLEGGSEAALDNLNRLLAANFSRLSEQRAS
jgi:hypothetical protein